MLSITRWIVIVAALFVAGWFAFDAMHAIVVGDYVTPASGPYAGQLGPWAKIVEAVGVAPRSHLMHAIFIAYAAVWLPVIALYTIKVPLSRLAMLVMAVGALWYIPFGTLLCMLQIVLLILPRRIASA